MHIASVGRNSTDTLRTSTILNLEMTATKVCGSCVAVTPPLQFKTEKPAHTTSSGPQESGPHIRGALSRMPTEIIIRLIYFLDSPTTVCFALACRDLCATVSDTTKMPLNILCRSRYVLKSCNGVKYWSRVGDYAVMMRTLRPWIPDRYELCISSGKYHLRTGKHYCAVCGPKPRRVEEGSFDAGKWNNLPWSKLVGGVKRVISTGKGGRPMVSWVERQTLSL